MPHLFFNNVDKDTVVAVSATLSQDISKIAGCPVDHLTFNHVDCKMYLESTEINDHALVEIKWFKRPQEVQDKVAKAVSQALRDTGFDWVTVYFTILEGSSYYENGQHF